MQLCIVLCTLLALSSARSVPYYAATPHLRSAYPFSYGLHSSSLVTPTQQQYHTQDDLGQYAYGYREPQSAKQEVRSLDGVTRGSYSYRDPEGKLRTVEYTADANGFRVTATNLPRPVSIPQFHSVTAATGPADTADVAAARADHFASHQAAQLRLAEHKSASVESPAVVADFAAVELRQPLGNTITADLATATAGSVAADVGHSSTTTTDTATTSEVGTNHLRPSGRRITATSADIPKNFPVAYQSYTIPRIYTYGYPLNSRFLSQDVYY